MLARLLNCQKGSDALSLPQLLATPMARTLGISPTTHHTTLPVVIAQAKGGAFQVLHRESPIAGDPYLTRRRAQRRMSLRLVQ